MSTDRTDPSLEFTLPFQITKKIHRDVPPELSPELPENSAKGKIIVITGGGSGIGAGSAKVWVRAGAEAVVIAGRRKDALDKTAAELNELSKEKGTGSKILAVQTDITKEADTNNLFAQVTKAFGRTADVILANAGALSEAKKPHLEHVDTWWNVYQVNVLGTHNVAVSWIKSQSNPDEPVGTLVSVSTALAGQVMPGYSAYSTSKMAVQRYIESLEIEYPTLRTFSVYPGVVLTDMPPESFYGVAKDKPEQTGAVALYLASSRADYLKGSVTSVNWDIEELEKHKDEIQKGLLKIKYMPILPSQGGSGL